MTIVLLFRQSIKTLNDNFEKPNCCSALTLHFSLSTSHSPLLTLHLSSHPALLSALQHTLSPSGNSLLPTTPLATIP
ncbi:hypothetical protein BH14170 [Bartonella henselae str. Houston-1]|uniref:Uncharacterized protein n=1 Tax=Bartonella henselae (strain ATCC 49882 / DSM 28221 / CCUG 30454 / Houston 1) TaxID=283166 RepID=A0A0H3M6Q3_BARHE|nr:hypothetical protein BH14170 [Bartonella henselae str. Houston-1]